MVATTLLVRRALQGAAKLRSASSSVASVYASASSHTHFCVISNANAYGFSRLQGAAHSESDR
jgi:hypothetical protein